MPPRQRSVTPTPTPSTAPQTPRKRKSPSKRLHGTQPTSASPKWTPSTISDALVKQLKLTFTPDPWQTFILDKIIRRFDAAICAGTSYGKSLIFEGLVVVGGPGKVVVVLCPLKALEIDQVSSACAKGIDAVTINEDTPDAERKSMWKRIRSTAEIVYISPEMALSVGFQSLWADTKFRKRLTALIIDEGHCISEWGTQKFRPEYGLLNRLRSYTGQDVPFVTCTGTCPTTTFDKIWTSLGSFPYRITGCASIGVLSAEEERSGAPVSHILADTVTEVTGVTFPAPLVPPTTKVSRNSPTSFRAIWC